jgi:hypothetical protein
MLRRFTSFEAMLRRVALRTKESGGRWRSIKARLIAQRKVLAAALPAFGGSLVFTSDHALAAAGLAAAIGSASFAGYMIIKVGADRAELIPADAAPAEPEQHSPGPKSAARPEPPQSDMLDFGATGTIIRPPEPQPALPPNVEGVGEPTPDLAVKGFYLRFADEGAALVQGPSGIYAVVPGARIPEAGIILAIEKRAGRWIVVTQNGTIEKSGLEMEQGSEDLRRFSDRIPLHTD